MSVAKKLHRKSIDEKLLKKLVPLNALGADRLHELAEKADIENASPSRVLFKRGDTDAKTYYLLSGEIEVQLANGQNVLIKADTPAALHPLLDARPRPATAVIKSHATLLVIDTSLFEILVNYDQKQKYEVSEIQAHSEADWLTRFLQSLSAMNIPVKNIEHLMRRMQEQPVRAGETVIRQSDVDSQHYYVIKEGRCVITKHATTTDKTPIRIAELSAGVGFGEEALLADQPRSASVTMLTDGTLMRLTKADFTQLIADPALHYVTYQQAQQMAQAGALWLDTRNSAEHRERTINGSVNIPLAALRSKIKELNTYGKYIAFCDTGNRAAAAAFLLRQMGFSAYVLSDGLRDVPASALLNNSSPKVAAPARTAQVDPPAGPLKVQPQSADTVDELARQKAALAVAHAEVEQLRAQLAATRSSEQAAQQQIAQHAADSTRERDSAQAEQARMRAHIAELEALRATADRTLASHQERVRELQAQANEYKLSLSAADAAYNTAQKELNGLSHTHTHLTENLQQENSQLKTRVAATTTEVERMKHELERAVERNRTAEEALLSAEREIARLQAEADAAQRRAEESMRQANESESLQSTILKEVQRKIEAAELMRLEAEEQAQRLREAAELSRKRAEQESRKVAEAEAARMKAQEESERRARMADDIRKKAELEMLRLKKDADEARANADDARKKSQLADAARRRLEQEMQTAQTQARAQSKAAEKPAAPPAAAENDLDDLERELAQLQQKLEAKKRAAVTRNQQVNQVAEQKRTAEPEIVQNVYDLHQKTQKLPSIKPNQPAPNDVGKVRKSGWISDSILWETTIGLREDSEAEKFLDNENAQRATSAAAAAKRQETNARAHASGELKNPEIKRSVFTTRESAPTIQRHVEVSGRGPQRIGIIALLSVAGIAAGIGAYVLLHKAGNSPTKLAPTIVNPAPGGATSGVPVTLDAIPAPTNEQVDRNPKASTATSNGNGAITRKETHPTAAATTAAPTKQKVEATKLPARKAAPINQAPSTTPGTEEPPVLKSTAPAPQQAAPESAPTSQSRTVPSAGSEPSERAQPAAEPAPAETAPVVPSFSDAPRVN